MIETFAGAGVAADVAAAALPVAVGAALGAAVPPQAAAMTVAVIASAQMRLFMSPPLLFASRVATPTTIQNAPLEPEADRFYRDLVDQRPALIDEKLKLHARIIDEFNLGLLEKLPHEEFVRQISAYVTNYVRAENLSLNQKELNVFSEEIIAEMIGYGPIEPLLKDPTVTDILINTHEVCFVERFGKLYETKVHFKDEAHLLRIVNKIVAGVGRRVVRVALTPARVSTPSAAHQPSQRRD